MKSSCNCKAEQCQSIHHPSYNILKLKRENLNFFSQDSKNHLTSQKLRKCVSFPHFKHKINDFAAKLIRIVSFNASDEIKDGRHGCIFSVVKRLLSGKALNTLLYLVKNANTSSWSLDMPPGTSHHFSHNQKHLVP